jgi:hypothetical protein
MFVVLHWIVRNFIFNGLMFAGLDDDLAIGLIPHPSFLTGASNWHG